jgi:RNA 3'-terminal phosphate cyclase
MEACTHIDGRLDKGSGLKTQHLAGILTLARGDSCFVREKVTGHLLTNVEIIRKFLPAVINLDMTAGEVRVRGAGFTVPV